MSTLSYNAPLRALMVIAVGIFLVVLAFMLLARRPAPAPAPAPSAGETHADVVLTDAGFQPSEVHLKLNGTVIFSTTLDRPFWPASDPHPSHSLYPAFDPQKPIAPNSSWSFTFDTPGTWQFHDHLRSYFTGTIYVAP